MFLCPDCDSKLSRAKVTSGSAWVCGKCSGRAMTMPVLRRLVEAGTLRLTWSRTFEANVPSKRPCPACELPMLQVFTPVAEERIPLDVCRRCQLIWFDTDEFESMPNPPAPPVAKELPPEVKQHLAIAAVTEELRQARLRTAEEMPGLTDLRFLPALLGLPVELHGAERASHAYATWFTAVAVAAISIHAFVDDDLIQRFAFVPDQPWRLGGLTMLTVFFLHGGWLHLIGNLYFFVVFGDNVEDFLGRRRWLLLLAAATAAGSMLHAIGEPDSEVPCVGASGGISGLITYYALRLPHARLGAFLRVSWFTFPAWGGFVVWLAMQMVLLLQQLSGLSAVSALAHVGGAAVGVIAWLLTRDRSLQR